MNDKTLAKIAKGLAGLCYGMAATASALGCTLIF